MERFIKMYQEIDARRCPSYLREYYGLITELEAISKLCYQLDLNAEQFNKPTSMLNGVLSSDRMEEFTDVFLEQKKVVKSVREETKIMVEEYISALEKVKENIDGMFKSDDEFEEPQKKKRRGEEEKETDLGIETSGGSSLVKLRGEISLKNTGKEVLHVCVNHIHEEAILRPSFNPDFAYVVNMQEAEPGETLKVTISHNRLPPWQSKREPGPASCVHIAEFAFAHGKRDEKTEWKYLWVPYKVFWT